MSPPGSRNPDFWTPQKSGFRGVSRDGQPGPADCPTRTPVRTPPDQVGRRGIRKVCRQKSGPTPRRDDTAKLDSDNVLGDLFDVVCGVARLCYVRLRGVGMVDIDDVL